MATLATYSPSGSTAKLTDTISFGLTNATAIAANTITLSLADEHGTTYAVLTNGAFLTASGWAGRIVTNVTATPKTAHVVIDTHPRLVSGSWTATVSVSSVTVGTWTFELVDVLSGVFECVKGLLEGSLGTGRTIPANTFRHVDGRAQAMGALAAAGSCQPFTLTHVGPGDQDAQGYLICGDHSLDNEVIRISIAHAMRDQAMLEFEQDRARDNYFIRHCLQWPSNWALAVGWVGATLTGPVYEELEDESGRVAVVVSNYDLDCTIREHHP